MTNPATETGPHGGANPSMRDMANAIRALSMDAVEKANSGHPGMPMGMAPTAYALWTRIMNHNPANPQWLNRDRFVLSAGHGSMLLYSMLHLCGYDHETDDDASTMEAEERKMLERYLEPDVISALF